MGLRKEVPFFRNMWERPIERVEMHSPSSEGQGAAVLSRALSANCADRGISRKGFALCVFRFIRGIRI